MRVESAGGVTGTGQPPAEPRRVHRATRARGPPPAATQIIAGRRTGPTDKAIFSLPRAARGRCAGGRGDAIGGGPRKPLRDGGDEPGEGGGWSGRGGRRIRHEPEKNKHQQRARRGCCSPISLFISSTLALRSALSLSLPPLCAPCLSRLLLDRELTRRSRRPWFSERGGEEPCAAGKGASFQRYRKGESASVSPARIGYGFG